MSLFYECSHCAGSGQDFLVGQGDYGPIFAGACHVCGGKGLVREQPTPHFIDHMTTEDHEANLLSRLEMQQQNQTDHDLYERYAS